ncbi:hypothetical protein C7271_18585, partial [filamentous cyanobacterium CCP5]
MASSLDLHIRARLEQWDFEGLFCQDLGWAAPEELELSIDGRWLAIAGSSAAVEIPVNTWPDRSERRSRYAQLRQQIADPLVIWGKGDRCLWQ